MKQLSKPLPFITTVILIVSTLMLSNCSKDSNGPYLGNGVLNGWADQNSIVIWTRLTATPDLNSAGQKFLIPLWEEHNRLDAEADSDAILKAQIPEGFSLSEMEGACPGAVGEVKLTYFMLKKEEIRGETDWTPVDPEKNYTVQWIVDDLRPNTEYGIMVEARKNKRAGVSDRITGVFWTPAEPETISDLDFIIITCNDYPRRDRPDGHQIYETMLEMNPRFFVHTGDIEYYDKPSPYGLTEELMRFKWDRIFALPLQREFYRNVTSYFMRDDHDVLSNDAYPGMQYGTVSFDRGNEIFEEQVPSKSHEKFYKTVRCGRDLQIWITEGRKYRSKNTDPDGPGKTIWGKDQKEWLFKTIKESDATYKVVISGTPILGPDSKKTGDAYAHDGYKHEGDEIRKYLSQFDNVFIVTGDRHWQYASNIPGTSLWEFATGAGSYLHAHGWWTHDWYPELGHRYLRSRSGGGFLKGSIYFEGYRPNQRYISYKDGYDSNKVYLKFTHHDVNGNVLHEEIFSKMVNN